MKIGYLADHKQAIPLLGKCFHQEWSYFYPERSVKDFELLIRERANRDRLPLALVGHEGDELIGTVCLKIHDMDNRLDLSPWLAGLYVLEPFRKRGFGRHLVSAIEAEAQALGISRLHLYTPASERFYQWLGWRVLEKTAYHGYAVTLMIKDFVRR